MMFYFGITVLLFLLPYLYLTMRNFPEDKGLAGEPNSPITSAVLNSTELTVDGPDLNVKKILATPAFWFISLTLGLLFMSQTGVLTNIGAYMQGAGVGDKTKTLIFTLAGMGLIGKLSFGYAADRINLKYGLWGAILLAAAGVSVLASEPSYPAMIFAALLMGLATGGMLPVWGAMIAVVFGMKSYGRANGCHDAGDCIVGDAGTYTRR